MGRSETDSPGPLIAVRVSRIEPIALDTRLFELSAGGCEALPVATPGAHIAVHLSAGLVRHYSLLTPFSNSSNYVIAVQRAASGRGGSQWLHERVTVGSELLIGRPRNHFPLNESADESILLAGGIGITPIYAMFERLQAIKRNVQLHYWSRSPAHTLFRDRLQNRPDVTLHHSAPGRETVASVLARADRACEMYCCGPERMLREFELATQSHGVRSWHVERFAAAAVDEEASSEFSVILAKSGTEVLVHRGETILSALRDASIDVAYSCEEGVCGACEVRFLAGEPLHRDQVRTAAEHDRLSTVMICCAGSRTKRLTLDL